MFVLKWIRVCQDHHHRFLSDLLLTPVVLQRSIKKITIVFKLNKAFGTFQIPFFLSLFSLSTLSPTHTEPHTCIGLAPPVLAHGVEAPSSRPQAIAVPPRRPCLPSQAPPRMSRQRQPRPRATPGCSSVITGGGRGRSRLPTAPYPRLAAADASVCIRLPSSDTSASAPTRNPAKRSGGAART